MWKNQDDATAKRLEFSSKKPEAPSEEPLGEELIEGYVNDTQSETGKSMAGPPRILAEPHQPSVPATSITPYPANMAAYTEAVNEFTKNATAFIEQLPLLSKAREAYDRAMKASAELRKVLDNGDEDLRALMTQLAQVLDGQVARPIPEKKKPELAKREAIRGTDDEGTRSWNAFP
jgi:hypothetical protein